MLMKIYNVMLMIIDDDDCYHMTHLSIHPSIIHPSNHPYIHKDTHPSISIHHSNHHIIKQSNKSFIIHLFTQLYIHHPSLHHIHHYIHSYRYQKNSNLSYVQSLADSWHLKINLLRHK